MGIAMRFWALFLVCASCCTLRAGGVARRVHEVSGTLPELPTIDVASPDRFLNDLMLSPYWKVERRDQGVFVATARSVGRDTLAEGHSFLFELMMNPSPVLPRDCLIRNGCLVGGRSFNALSISVVFQKPERPGVAFGRPQDHVVIPVHESQEETIGRNSESFLAISLSSQHEIYVVLSETGPDQTRAITFSKALPAMRELARLAATPAEYRVDERYAEFFALFFTSTAKDHEIQRFPGNQGRDIFYGFFRTKPDTSYAGVNIKISHPVYCPDEGTDKRYRLAKAEYLGKPYCDGDLVFFHIEDNSVSVPSPYDQRFGVFTGHETFEGDIEVLNDREQTLLKAKGLFTSHEQ
jgi:hypothetical protein